ncbi:hypothetical protein ASPZODRAFT_2129495 [Penicilliopsis zonata CBS 506.65]|uniref:Uncharacterized protein n=1 Tax=Penicilliopsis zonata CBS 506.65 TaxID=1073090 RepID=A0A1L9SH99_9EURO|nr:hypothetical protein ASPZODRAFT_2129495 [Penicilliopsis zonata CBS 506.65]OJJ46473.1 hypothetical protein ASPZODRAFT_2129495 [Penicilliopsis zonata CBS 506.65]
MSTATRRGTVYPSTSVHRRYQDVAFQSRVHGHHQRLLEQHGMLQANPQIRRFAWYAPYFQVWHPILYVLDTLHAEPDHKDAEKAWRYIQSVYERNPSMIWDMNRPVHLAMRNACLKAYAVRNTQLELLFIAQLQRPVDMKEMELNDGMLDLESIFEDDLFRNALFHI